MGDEETGRRIVRRRQSAEEVEYEFAARVCASKKEKGWSLVSLGSQIRVLPPFMVRSGRKVCVGGGGGYTYSVN